MQQEIWFQKYRILGLLGSGGNARVYLAEHIKLNSLRAIKYISKNHPLYDLQCKEALILKNLKHSNIPIIYDIEEDADGSYIVEQYLEGDTLKKYISSNGPLNEAEIIRLGLQLCDLIEYLHSIERPVYYLDLKPDNLILAGRTLKLIDFGSAIYRDELTDRQCYFATKGYAAPELYNSSMIDERCDVYGIGMLLYFMATGIYISNERKEIDNIDCLVKCSARLKKIINNCLKFHPAQRYSSVCGLKRQLSAVRQKNQYQSEPDRTVKIAIAGAQSRIGVTHLSFRLSRYLRSLGCKSLYCEKNGSDCIWSVKNCYEEVDIRNTIYKIEGIHMLAGSRAAGRDSEGYPYDIQDFGVLSEDNLADYLAADIKLLVLGVKDWELTCAQRVINMTAEYKEIAYLFNYIDGRQFQRMVRSMDHRKCYRIPYEPDPYAKMGQKSERDFFHELVPSLHRSTWKGKASALFRRSRLTFWRRL